MSTTNLRAATFLAEQARLDFRRGRTGAATKVRCKPPNRACGNRCIPPNWNCRLLGEGNDGHLKAAGIGSDPVAGFANLQRGFSNIGKGITRLSFTEVESGRRSLARGTAKLLPGDLKKKEEAKKTVYNYAMWVLTPVVIGIGAALTHKGLKSFRIYREGVGADIDNTFREVTEKIARNTPFGIGEGIRAREAAGRRGLASVRTSEAARRQTLTNRTGTSTTFLQSTSSRRNPRAGDGTAAINKALESAKTNTTSVEEWYNRSLSAFWGVKRSGDLQKIAGGIGEGSLYSIDSANTLLSRSLGLRGTDGRPLDLPGTDLAGESRQVRALIRSRIAGERENIAVGMRQAGLNPKDAGAVQEYLRRNAKEWETGDVDIDNELSKTIINTMTNSDNAKMADEFYRRTVTQFDTYYRDINDLVANTPGFTTLNARQRQLYQDAVRGHAKYLAGTMDFDMPIEGAGSIALFKKVYYRRRVVGKSARYATVSLTDTELASVASELGIDIKKLKAPALEVAINRHFEAQAFNPFDPKARVKPKIVVRRYKAPAVEAQQKITEKEVTTPEVGATSPTPEGALPKPKRRYTANINQITNRLIRAGYTPEEARIKAAKYIAEREARRAARGDSADWDWTARDDAHLETWIRLDKRCGKSGIPDNQKCSKQTAAQSAAPSEEGGLGKAVSTAGKVALAAGVIAGGVAAYKHRRPIGKAFAFGKAVVKSERQLYNNIKAKKLAEKNSYGGGKYSPRAAARAARQEYIANRQESIRQVTPWVSDQLVKKLSTQEVYEGLNKLPKQFQEPVRNLVGDAKRVAIGVGLRAEGLEVISVTNKHNFATYKAKDGTLASVGSVGDSLIVYHSQLKGEIQGVPEYGMAFRVDNKYDQRKGLAPEQADSIKKATKAMFEEQTAQMPDNAFIFNKPYKDDGLGRKREAAYKRQGFRRLARGERMWAIKDQGKFRKLSDPELEALFKILNEAGRADEAEPAEATKSAGEFSLLPSAKGAEGP